MTSDNAFIPKTHAVRTPSILRLRRSRLLSILSDSGIRRKGVDHRAPTAIRKTAATGVDGVKHLFHIPRRLFFIDRFNNLRFRVDTGSEHCFPEGSSQDAQSAPATISSQQRYTNPDLRMAHPYAKPRTSTGRHLALRGGRRLIPNNRSGPASQLQPLGRLQQQQNPGRNHFPVSTSPDDIHTVPERKNRCEQHTDGRPHRRVPRPHTPLGSPETVRHNTVNNIKTTPGLPVSSRSRRLAPDRFAIAKAEFDAMLRDFTARCLVGSWSSALLLAPRTAAGARVVTTGHSTHARSRIDIPFAIFTITLIDAP
jgi:hypothetical protein